MQGENARLHAQVIELSNKQALVQADVAFISDYKVNSALARHSLHARCNHLQAQLSEAKSALIRRDSCASPTSLSKHSSRDCSGACEPLGFAFAQPSFLSATSNLPLESSAASAPLQDGSSSMKACKSDSGQGVDAGAAAQLLTAAGESLNSEPTSEDLDASPCPKFTTFGTTAGTSTSLRETAGDGESAVGKSSVQAPLKNLPELSRQITEDSLIKSSSFSLQPSSVATRCESDAVVVSHTNISAAGTFQDSSGMLAHEVTTGYSKSVQPAWTTQTAATDSSRMDSDLLAVLSDCPSPSVVNPGHKGADGSLGLATTTSTVPTPQQSSVPCNAFTQSGGVPQAAPDVQRLPEVFESLDLAHFLEVGQASKAVGAGIAVPLLTIPAPPPQLASHKSSAAASSECADAQNPVPPCVADSVDLSSFIKVAADTPRDGESTARSVNVMDSVDLSAFMKIESECWAMTAAQNEGPVRVICLLYTSPSPRDRQKSRMPSSA